MKVRPVVVVNGLEGSVRNEPKYLNDLRAIDRMEEILLLSLDGDISDELAEEYEDLHAMVFDRYWIDEKFVESISPWEKARGREALHHHKQMETHEDVRATFGAMRQWVLNHLPAVLDDVEEYRARHASHPNTEPESKPVDASSWTGIVYPASRLRAARQYLTVAEASIAA
ncbi:hypothetical protein ACRAQ6_06245 [Erythrobacter sp. HA6-11]